MVFFLGPWGNFKNRGTGGGGFKTEENYPISRNSFGVHKRNGAKKGPQRGNLGLIGSSPRKSPGSHWTRVFPTLGFCGKKTHGGWAPRILNQHRGGKLLLGAGPENLPFLGIPDEFLSHSGEKGGPLLATPPISRGKLGGVPRDERRVL